ncbi:glycosyltransferase family 25 protein [Pseudochrobactrum sp. HB0163]|uniref:glycosyltransferase family 25 protein n=1 Tax=Pseudochrobactrum sp. HB0163 TaxID=3450708 RepID=UPI003F6DC2B7
MKCYLINLDRSPRRLATMQAQFERYNIVFSRVAAVDGKNLSRQTLEQLTDPASRWEIPLPASEIGCFLSHKKCLQLVAEGAEPFAAIFEDDVTLSQDIGHFLAGSSWIPDDADIVKIDTNETIVLLDDLKSIDQTQRMIARLCNKHLCCGGYIVSRKAARLILQHMDLISVPVDNLIYDPACGLFSQLTSYQLVPALCKQINADSLIEADRRELRKHYKKRPSLPVLIWREMMRPYKRNAHIIGPKNIWRRLTSSKRWLKVPFRF